MSIQSPRNAQEWQKMVEQKLAAARTASRTAIIRADEASNTVREEVDNWKALTPAAPVEVVYSTATYIDHNKRRRGKITADFPDVVLSTNAKPVFISSYEISGQDQGLMPLEPFRSMGIASESSIVVGNLNPGSTWKFKVRALNGTVKPGLWSSEQTVTVLADTTPPPAPSAPVVTAVGGGVKYVWDGLAAGGAAMPGDFERVEVAFGLAASPTTVIDTFYAASLGIQPKSSYGVPHYIRLRAFDSSGNASAWSVQGVATPTPLVDVDVILAHIDAAETAITNIGEESIKSGAILAGHLKNGEISLTKLTQSVQDTIANGNTAYTSLDGINSSINGKNKIVRQTGNATGTTGYVTGDRWEKWSTLATGGKLLATWRYTGTQWLQEELDATYIPLIDIGAGTFGELSGTRMKANSVEARHIVIGDFQNFAKGSDFEDAASIPWAFPASGAHYRTNGNKKFGSYSLRMIGDPAVQTSTLLADMKVTEGEQYFFRYHAYIDSTFNGSGGNSKLRVGDQNGALIADKTYVNITRSVWTTLPLEMTVIVPAGVTSLQVTLSSDHTLGNAYVDDIQIRRIAEASLIQNLGVEKLVANAATIGQAVIDKLWAEVVRAKRMTTDMLVVGRGVNGIVDEFFEADDVKAYRNLLAGSWGTYGNSPATGLNTYGSNSLPGTTARSFYFDTLATYDKNSYIPVEPGQVWLLKATYLSTVSGPRATVRWIKRDGTTAYQSAGWTKRDGTTNSFEPAGGPRSFERIFTVPADVTHIMPAVQFESTCTSATIYGGATFTNMTTASLVVDGAIQARNLTVTDEMWVKIIKFKAISGDEIDVNSIVADTGKITVLRGGILINDVVDTGVLKSDAITSKHTITGATFQTLATANRGIKFTGGNLKVWNSTGTTETFSITGATGAVNGTGTWKTGSSGNFAELLADSNGGLLRFWTGSGTGRGSIYARDDAGGKRMTLSFSDLDAPTGTVPLFAVHDTKVSMDYGSKHIKVGDNGSGGEVLELDATGADVMVKGGLELSTSSARIRWRYSSSNFALGYVGQRPETNSGVADFEVRAAANGVRLTGTELIANPVYTNTSSSAANVFVDSNGKMWRSTSASKYKADQRVLTVPDSLLDIQMKDWVDKNQLALFEEMSARAPFEDETEQSRFDAINLAREPGVIAEDVEAHGGQQFAIYGPDGAIEGVKYERLALAQIQVLKRQLDELRALINA